MKPMPALILACTLLAACGYKQDEFATDYADSTCTLYNDCAALDVLGYEDKASCVAALGSTFNPASNVCEGWDNELAETCIMQIDQLACEQLYDGVFPTVCDSVCGTTGG